MSAVFIHIKFDLLIDVVLFAFYYEEAGIAWTYACLLVWRPGLPPAMDTARVTRTPRDVCLAQHPAVQRLVICLPAVHSDTINNTLLIPPFVAEILLNATRSFI